jgi:hypothetical protein
MRIEVQHIASLLVAGAASVAISAPAAAVIAAPQAAHAATAQTDPGHGGNCGQFCGSFIAYGGTHGANPSPASSSGHTGAVALDPVSASPIGLPVVNATGLSTRQH